MGIVSRMFGSRTSQATRFMPVAAPPVRPQAAEPRLVRPGEAFTPTQPRAGRRRLVGRQAELRRVLQALLDDRAHVVLYAERGRGKTSLANLVVEALRRDGVIVARHTCEAGSTFDSIVHGLMRDLPQALLAGDAADGEGCEAALPVRALRPRDVVELPQRLTCRRLVCVIDEFDRVEDAGTKIRLADTIKQLSDSDVPLLFLVVGVSENLDQILGHHPSIQRSVIGVHLPLFTDRDIAQIIAKGASESGFGFSPAIVARIAVLSRGMPTTAQLMGLRLVQAAIERGANTVVDDDFEAAVERLIEDASPRAMALYAALTVDGQDVEMVRALRRVAAAPQDAWGRLQVMVTGNGEYLVGGQTIPAACWERIEDACLLQPNVAGSGLFTFADRALMQHALLLAARDLAPPEAPHGAPLADIQAAPSGRRSEWMVS